MWSIEDMCRQLRVISQDTTELGDDSLLSYLQNEGLVSKSPSTLHDSAPRYVVTRAGRRFIDDNCIDSTPGT